MTNCCEIRHDVVIDKFWLEWRNGTVTNLVRAIMEEECDECQIIHGERSRYVNFGPDSRWEKCSCNNGYVPRAEPQWDMMPILADALEEAMGNCGGYCQELLDHLRLPATTHCAGCWCVELLMACVIVRSAMEKDMFHEIRVHALMHGTRTVPVWPE